MNENEISAVMVIAGTLLPFIGVGASISAAIFLKGALRWAVLYLGPAATALVCNAIAGPVIKDGNMLAMIIYILFFLLLIVYYPALTIYACIVAYRNRKIDRAAD